MGNQHKATPRYISEFEVRIAKALGFVFNEETKEAQCSQRKGVVFWRSPSGKLRPVVKDLETGEDYVCSCEHEAMAIVREAIDRMSFMATIDRLLGLNTIVMPEPEDYVYCFTEDQEEPETESYAEANKVLAAIMGGGK